MMSICATTMWTEHTPTRFASGDDRGSAVEGRSSDSVIACAATLRACTITTTTAQGPKAEHVAAVLCALLIPPLPPSETTSGHDECVGIRRKITTTSPKTKLFRELT
uniref:Secreted protein n=1 Tax=Panagrellus redivivus TaxID=6233 RepID=A0A7E4WBS8_PANRE